MTVVLTAARITRDYPVQEALTAARAVSDLLHFELSAVGPMNIPESGSIENAAEFRALLAVSPYHHIVDGTRYPAVLVSTAIDDTSVAVWHPAELAARRRPLPRAGSPSCCA